MHHDALQASLSEYEFSRKMAIQVEEDEHKLGQSTNNFNLSHHFIKEHQMLVQLDELLMKCESRDENEEWHQLGRWIRYEEAVEKGAQRFGKPKLSSLSFHALLQLRHCFEIGAVMLDLNLDSYENVFEGIVEEMVRTNTVHRTDRDHLLHLLKLPRRHTFQPSFQPPEGTLRTFGRYFGFRGNKECDSNVTTQMTNGQNISPKRAAHTRRRSVFPWDRAPWNTELLKRLSTDAEAASVSVGTSAKLRHLCIAFVRLHPDTYIENQVELPLPLRYLFVILGPITPNLDFHEIGRSLCALLANRSFRDACSCALDRTDIIQAINDFLDESTVIPPGDWELDKFVEHDFIRTHRVRHTLGSRRRALVTRPVELDQYLLDEEKRKKNDPLRRTGVVFGGLKREVQKRYPYYISDLTDAFNLQCVRCVIFIFLTCFFPALTFGAIIGEITNGEIGMIETLLATSLGGITFALLSTQPLIVMGVVGSMLIFEESLYEFSSVNGFPYLAMRFWVSVWAFLFAAVVVCFEGSLLIRNVTRFSDDILSALISVIFFSECIRFLWTIFSENPLMTAEQYCNSSLQDMLRLDNNSTSSTRHSNAQPNTALLAVFFTAATFLIAFALRRVRNSRYFGRQVRRALGDFGLSISVILMVVFDKVLISASTLTSTLNITIELLPSAERSWLVNIFEWPSEGTPLPMAAILPGFLLFFLLFTETLVCEMMLLNPQLKVKKGTGYHFDLLLSGLLLVANALFGLPWLCAASMRTTAHIHSLTLYRLRAPGQKPSIVGLREQRLTTVALHALIGSTLLFPSVLKSIPQSVLFGVFLYLGVMNLTSSQMLSRSILFFVPVKYHPSVSYCLRVRTWRMHAFTTIQLLCFIIVCFIKSHNSTAFAFPLAVLMAVAVRQFLLPKLFTSIELMALDGIDEEPSQDGDFYEDSRKPALLSSFNVDETF
ncbi:unnamed protein product [Anisakis simplex]|uniref:Anion exchange protein n=1 Tax=Anisakis simplex TaxID=6269 RepID=A0A0M3JZ47_ANISI|nr:unnamed protein product [Anisakis simplex]